MCDLDWSTPRLSTTPPTELKFEAYDDADGTDKFGSIEKQRRDWQRLINVDAINNMPYDDSLVPKLLKYLHTSCNCRHGNRTVNCCGHVSAVLSHILDQLQYKDYEEQHQMSVRWSEQVINIQPFLNHYESDSSESADFEYD